MPLKDYSGFGLFQIGYGKWNGKKLWGIDMLLVNHEQKPSFVYNSNGVLLEDWGRKRESVELRGYQAYPLLGNIDHGLFAGPLVSFGVIRNLYVANNSGRFPLNAKCYCLGIGGTANYQLKLWDRLYFTASTNLLLINFAYNNDRIENPALTLRQQEQKNFETSFLKKEFPLFVGINFSF